MNNITPSTQAVLLLTSSFSKHARNEEKPLSVSEWGLFAAWLHVHKMKPEDLLEKDFEENLKDWSDETISLSRLKKLLNRGAALALAIEKWQRIGLWVITRSDKEYPQNIKRKLKHLSPPILYGIGNKDLLNVPTIAVTGSRNADKTNLNYAYEIGSKIAKDGLALVSGGAKGVDEYAMQGTLDHGGNGIVILAEDLLKYSLSSKYRNALLQNNLVLISPYYPESSFSVANAMARNKYIYTLSIASVIVCSNSSGGTWTGANEVLKKQWTPLWVKESSDSKSPNQILINAGANILTQGVLKNHIQDLQFNTIVNKAPTLFDIDEDDTVEELVKPLIEEMVAIEFNSELSLYDFFIYKLEHTFKHDDIFKPKEVEELFELKTAQINEWLIKSEIDNIVVKLDGRARRYKLKDPL